MPRFDVRFWTQDISRESVDAPGKRAGIQLGNNLLWQYYLSLPLSVSLSLSLSLELRILPLAISLAGDKTNYHCIRRRMVHTPSS